MRTLKQIVREKIQVWSVAINLPNTTKLNFEDVIAEACKEWLNENLELLNNRILSSTSLDLIRYEYEKLIEGCNK